MIERDVGDNRDPEVEDVGAVEASPEPHLADEHVGAGAPGGEDAGGGEDLEAGRLQLVGQGSGRVADRADQLAELRLAHRLSVADDALAVRLQVRAGDEH